MRAPKLKPVCRVCAGPVRHGNLYCSELCGKYDYAQLENHAFYLKKRGFVEAGPNIYHKDGAAVTLEGVRHVGLSETLNQHAAALGRNESL